MPPLSTSEEERARKYEALILQRLASTGLAAAAMAAEVDESTISRWMQHVKSAEQLAQEAGY